ncbi:phospho-sugar mutase, partial [Kibdelosporangium lantanae]
LGVPGPDGWRMLRGDETGSVLGAYVLSTLDRVVNPDPLVATTIVSSSLLGKIAAAQGVRYDETLTGFKWLVRAGDGQGTGLVFGYEEALGNCVDPSYVRDKDGISAAVVAADLAATLKAEGKSFLDVLDDLMTTHGVHLTDQISLRVDDLSVIRTLMAQLRDNPPSSFASVEVKADFPQPDILRLTGEGIRVIIRPSGTEPKLKAYLEVVVPVSTDLGTARAAATERLSTVQGEIKALLGA